MRICVLCVGSQGDVAPFVALGSKLKSEGHDVVLATHEKFRAFTERFSLPFQPIGGDLSLTTTPEESRDLFAATGFMKVISIFKLMRLFYKVLDGQLQDSFEAARNADMVIYHQAAFAGPHLAEHFHVPAVQMFLQPELPTAEHPSCLVGMPKWLGRIGNLIGHWISQQFLWQVFRGKINHWRVEHLKLSKSPFWKPTNYSNIRNLVAFSPSLIPRPTDWNSSIGMTGFCRVLEEQQWQPSPALSHFLQDGEPPLYLGFGSLSETFSPEDIKMMITVLKERKIRTIVPKNLPGLQELKPPSPYIFAIDYVPHDWLFPRVSAVIHHGGVGTLSSGLHAGKPTWVMPCIVDQFFFGEKVVEWGIGPLAMPRNRITQEAFSAGLDRLLNTPSYRENALQFKEKLSKENGVEAAYSFIFSRNEEIS
ncbi:MAG: hypothetical protein A3F67_11930 [Verrucomicrobia bacterium RIFCSPHIGHO2_12_FULL_41_10]|nr:MAG: hypothetical protein A3F67_11930 [Verrucomicrobia bacterium RIFCSPHIGHO2_12_FULL_41_10]